MSALNHLRAYDAGESYNNVKQHFPAKYEQTLKSGQDSGCVLATEQEKLEEAL